MGLLCFCPFYPSHAGHVGKTFGPFYFRQYFQSYFLARGLEIESVSFKEEDRFP